MDSILCLGLTICLVMRIERGRVWDAVNKKFSDAKIFFLCGCQF
jgi:hypothetical protein